MLQNSGAAPLKSVARSNESVGGGCFAAVLGAAFVAAGVLGAFGGIFPPNQGPPLLFAFFGLLGILMAWGGISQIHLASHVAPALASVEPSLPVAGEFFQFFWEQRVRRPLNVQSVGVFWVWCQRWSDASGDSVSVYDVDRLLAQSFQSEKTYQRGEKLGFEGHFVLPSREMRAHRFPNDAEAVEVMWVIKIRVVLASGHDIWHEFRVEAAPCFAKPQSAEKTPGFDVILPENPAAKLDFKGEIKTQKALAGVLRHLRAAQIGDLRRVAPFVVAEAWPESQARALAQQLEAAGVEAKILPTGRAWD